jgi:F0F1-type ATP synthase delta subunit
MSNTTTLARPYAKAAFELAEADKAVSSWDAMLQLASAAVSEKSLAVLLESPHASGDQIVQILKDAAGESYDAKFRKFLDVLAENKRLSLLPEIKVLFQELREEGEAFRSRNPARARGRQERDRRRRDLRGRPGDRRIAERQADEIGEQPCKLNF